MSTGGNEIGRYTGAHLNMTEKVWNDENWSNFCYKGAFQALQKHPIFSIPQQSSLHKY